MTRARLVLAFLAVTALLAGLADPAAGQGVPAIGIEHTPPVGVTPGYQIYLTATLTNATSAVVVWRNDTMTADAVMPMTNLSEANGAGWVFAAYLPPQPTPTQILYAINASNPGGSHVEGYFFTVDVASSGGLTPSDQEAWIWTIAASLAMVASTVGVLYWYTGQRLRREAR